MTNTGSKSFSLTGESEEKIPAKILRLCRGERVIIRTSVLSCLFGKYIILSFYGEMTLLLVLRQEIFTMGLEATS